VRPGRLEFLLGRTTVYSEEMNEPSSRSSSQSLGRLVLAGLVLLIAAYILLKIVIGIALAIAGPVALILAIVAIVWAVRVLL
jgi:hypothetical protein